MLNNVKTYYWRAPVAFLAIWIVPLALDLFLVVGWERFAASSVMRAIVGMQLIVVVGSAVAAAIPFLGAGAMGWPRLTGIAACASTAGWLGAVAVQRGLNLSGASQLAAVFLSISMAALIVQLLLAKGSVGRVAAWLGPLAWGGLMVSLVNPTSSGSAGDFQEVNVDVAAAADAPNVVLFVIDTLRADRSIGDPKSSWSSGFDAENWTVFSNAWSPASGTAPSVKSVLTGLPPSTWGRSQISKPPPLGTQTIALNLQQRGYRTGGLTANSLINGGGFSAGHQDYLALGGYDTVKHSLLLMQLVCGGDGIAALGFAEDYSLHKVDGQRMRELASDWVSLGVDGPFYLYLHIVDPHWPYREADGSPTSGLSHVDLLTRRQDDPRPEADALAAMEARYQGEIEHAHGVFRGVMDDLKGKGLLEDTLVIVLGDHGEEFFEHGGFSHGHDSYQEQVHVPVLVHWPRERILAGARFDQPFTATGVGNLIRAVLDGRSLPDSQEVISESYPPGKTRGMWRFGDIAVRIEFDDDVSPEESKRVEVFDLVRDPRQLVPLSTLNEAQSTAVVAAREALHERWQPGVGATSGSGSDDPAGVRGLEELGYTGD